MSDIKNNSSIEIKLIAISISFVLLFLTSTLQPSLLYVQYLEAQEEEVDQDSCIRYDSTEKVITLNCNSIITLKDIDKQLNDPQILHEEEENMTASNHDASDNDAKAVW